MNLEKLKNRYLQIAISLIYVWFGGLKFFSNLSPAEELAIDTIDKLTLFMIPEETSIILLAIWETLIGLFLLFNIQKKYTVRVTIFHMLLTFTPVFFYPDLIFGEKLFSLTLLGQYIIKNIVILAALGVLWAEVKQEKKVLTKKGVPLHTNLSWLKVFRLKEESY